MFSHIAYYHTSKLSLYFFFFFFTLSCYLILIHAPSALLSPNSWHNTFPHTAAYVANAENWLHIELLIPAHTPHDDILMAKTLAKGRKMQQKRNERKLVNNKILRLECCLCHWDWRGDEANEGGSGQKSGQNCSPNSRTGEKSPKPRSSSSEMRSLSQKNHSRRREIINLLPSLQQIIQSFLDQRVRWKLSLYVTPLETGFCTPSLVETLDGIHRYFIFGN